VTLRVTYQKLLASDPARWPDRAKELALSTPLFSVAVQPLGAGFEMKRPVQLPDVAACDLVCKLGIKSWRDSGSLRAIRAQLPLRPALSAMLETPTPQQRVLARAWTETKTPLMLRAMPYVDFSDISEVRWLVTPREARFVSACQRGSSGKRLGRVLETMQDLAREVSSQLPPYPTVMEFACLPDGVVRLVEINPGLEPAELRALQAA
jgi:hypothetical protein